MCILGVDLHLESSLSTLPYSTLTVKYVWQSRQAALERSFFVFVFSSPRVGWVSICYSSRCSQLSTTIKLPLRIHQNVSSRDGTVGVFRGVLLVFQCNRATASAMCDCGLMRVLPGLRAGRSLLGHACSNSIMCWLSCITPGGCLAPVACWWHVSFQSRRLL